MENTREKFTYQYYSEFICLLRETYTFITFQEGKKISGGRSTGLVILRHDVDMDLEAAVRLSSLEKERGVYSTYLRILADGQHFGLHFDCSLYQDITSDNISHYVSKECLLLEQFFERPVEAVSFHRPGKLEMSGVPLDGWPHSYERVFLEEFEYFSDSRAKWSKGNPLESGAFSEKKNLHILIHPVWWKTLTKNGRECLDSVIQQIGDRSRQYISENCEVWNKGESK